jgi:hypothetical protein
MAAKKAAQDKSVRYEVLVTDEKANPVVCVQTHVRPEIPEYVSNEWILHVECCDGKDLYVTGTRNKLIGIRIV